MKLLVVRVALPIALAALAALGALGGASCKRAEPPPTEPAPPATAAPSVRERIAAPGEAPAATEKAPETASAAPKAPDTSFTYALEVPPEVPPGAPAVATIKIAPGPGWKMNEEYPTALTLSPPPEGVALAGPAVLKKADAAKFDKHELSFAVKLRPAKAGTYTVNGTLAFAVCTEATCDPKTQQVAINLVAK